MSRYIDADALKAYYVDLSTEKDIGYGDMGRMITVNINHIIKTIDDAPSIDIEPKRGKWKTEVLNPLNAILRCSICGRYSVVRYNFCPDCGADNRGEGND